MLEEWRAVPGYVDLYEVSNCGRVRSIDRVVAGRHGPERRRGCMLKAVMSKKGYMRVVLAFIGVAPPGAHVCHNDGDPANNKPDNLRYGSAQDNSDDMLRHGRRSRGEKHNSKLTEEQVLSIFRSSERTSVLAAEHGVAVPTICNIRAGKRWAWLTGGVGCTSVS